MQRSLPPRLDQRTTYYAVVALVSLFFAAGSTAIVWWIVYQLRSLEPAPQTTPAYVNYSIAGDYTNNPQWAEAQKGYQQYVTQNPQPQNVQVLKGWSTAQIYAYMVTQVAGGMKVQCQYCHIINEQNGYNFAAEGNPNKVKARQMMVMAADLNQNFISKLPPGVGGLQGYSQVTCATCHNGNPVFNTYPDSIQVTQPDTFRLPLDLAFPGGLAVTGDTSKGLEDVALNQYTMYHMNFSLGQGCTYCHNARYFPSYEITQKYHAGTMLLMSQHLLKGTYPYNGDSTYGNPNASTAPPLVNPDFTAVMNGQTYLSIMNNRYPSCWMCHQQNVLPPGAARDGQAPPQLSTQPQQ